MQLVFPQPKEAPMKNLLVAVVVIAIAVGALGFWRGWFEFGSNKKGDNV